MNILYIHLYLSNNSRKKIKVETLQNKKNATNKTNNTNKIYLQPKCKFLTTVFSFNIELTLT